VTAGSGADNINYNFSVYNDGPADASNLVIQITELFDIVDLTCTSGPPTDADQRWNIGALAAGETTDTSVICTVGPAAAAGSTYSVELALYSVDQPDSDDTNDSSAEDSTVEVSADLSIEGIPTLSQYGLALMALLMLGIGFIGFRRFI
jgi:hypothetical protein